MTEHTYEIHRSESQATSNLLWIGGRVGVGLAYRDYFELREDGSLAWQAAIHWESSCSLFQSQLVWEEANAALFGAHDEVYALDIRTGAVILHRTLESYFGYFELAPFHRMAIVLTGTGILAFDSDLQEMWSSHHVAVDGIVCKEIGQQFLTVDAEMDPPGGWQRVTIDLKTGKEVSRIPCP